MKKLNDANMGIFVLLSVCLCLFSCNNDNDNLPKDYAGFEHSKETVECESDKSECELKIKIVATEKTKEDRTVVLATPPPVIGQATSLFSISSNSVSVNFIVLSVLLLICYFRFNRMVSLLIPPSFHWGVQDKVTFCFFNIICLG